MELCPRCREMVDRARCTVCGLPVFRSGAHVTSAKHPEYDEVVNYWRNGHYIVAASSLDREGYPRVTAAINASELRHLR